MIRHISTKDMSREEWLILRHRGLGSSDVGAVLGLNRFKTAFQVWQEKRAPKPPEDIESPKARLGLLIEDDIAELYMEETGAKVIRDNKIRFHPEHEFLFCNIDRLILPKDEGQGRGILEIKSVGLFAWQTWEAEIPLSYWAQVQHQMYVSGYRWGEFAVLVRETAEWTRIPFEYDKTYAENQAATCIKFWNENVLKGVPPDQVASDYEFAKTEPEKIVEAENEIVGYCTDLRMKRDEIGVLKGQAEELETKIKEAVGTAEILVSGGQTLATWKPNKDSEKFDQKTFAKDNPELVTKYTITVPGKRVFRLKLKPGVE
jgi:putative phage-type endonuclease